MTQPPRLKRNYRRSLADLTRRLALHQAVTDAQLQRTGLAWVAPGLQWPQIALHVKTQRNQPASRRLLTFHHDPAARVTAPSLLHDALLTEARWRLQDLAHVIPQPGNGTWVEIHPGDRGFRGNLPDALLEFRAPGPGGTVRVRRQLGAPSGFEVAPEEVLASWAVEACTGYEMALVVEKLRSYADQGYGTVVWATTVRARTASVPAHVNALHNKAGLVGLRLIVVYVDVHSFTLGAAYGAPHPGAPRTRSKKLLYSDQIIE